MIRAVILRVLCYEKDAVGCFVFTWAGAAALFLSDSIRSTV
jgi:hypothetical protein